MKTHSWTRLAAVLPFVLLAALAGCGNNPADSCPTCLDQDEDGYTDGGGDCDDNDAAVNPGEQEDCDDGDSPDGDPDDLSRSWIRFNGVEVCLAESEFLEEVDGQTVAMAGVNLGGWDFDASYATRDEGDWRCYDLGSSTDYRFTFRLSGSDTDQNNWAQYGHHCASGDPSDASPACYLNSSSQGNDAYSLCVFTDGQYVYKLDDATCKTLG